MQEAPGQVDEQKLRALKLYKAQHELMKPELTAVIESFPHTTTSTTTMSHCVSSQS